jgi:hypothetical protein
MRAHNLGLQTPRSQVGLPGHPKYERALLPVGANGVRSADCALRRRLIAVMVQRTVGKNPAPPDTGFAGEVARGDSILPKGHNCVIDLANLKRCLTVTSPGPFLHFFPNPLQDRRSLFIVRRRLRLHRYGKGFRGTSRSALRLTLLAVVTSSSNAETHETRKFYSSSCLSIPILILFLFVLPRNCCNRKRRVSRVSERLEFVGNRSKSLGF